MASLRFYVTVATLALVTGELIDSASTITALVNPLFRGSFEEVGNVFVIFLMYNLGLGTTGLFVGLAATWAFEIVLIWKAYSFTRASSFGATAGQAAAIMLFMILLAIGHWMAGLQNVALLSSLSR
ncbi:MAG: hypothetical protein ABSF63_13525 [Candidatus Bathyarchaeia archaeon]